jgi:hypothetical protein
MPGSPGFLLPQRTSPGVASQNATFAKDTALGIISFAQDTATEHMTIMDSLKASLLSKIDVPPIFIDYKEVNPTAPDFNDPRYSYVRPESPDAEVAFPPDPVHDVYRDVPVPDIPSFPLFNIPDPTIVDPVRPDGVLPDFTDVAPDLEFIGVPDLPDTNYPDPVEMTPVIFSPIPELDFPSFEGIRPVVSIDAPEVFITSGNNDYQSTLLDQINAKLLDGVVNGGTGLGAEIEQDMWDRESERARLALADSMEKASKEWAARGFGSPNGILAGMLIPLEVEYMNRRLDTSRDIAIKQAELALTNTHFILDKGIAVTQIALNWFNQVANRTFEASKAFTSALVNVHDAEVKRQSLLLEQYKADAGVYADLIKAEIAKLERIKVEVEMNKGVAEYDKNRVDSYKAQVDAVDVMIKSYGHEVEAVKSVAEIQKTKMEAFKYAVEAYVAQVNAKTSEYGMYTAAWNGEKTKADVYATRVEGFTKRLDAIKVDVQTKIEVMKSFMEFNKDALGRFVADVDFYKAKSSNNIAFVDEQLKLFASEVSRFQVDGSIFNNRTDLSIKQYDTEIQKYLKKADLMIKEAELQMKADEFNSTMSIETRKAIATVSAHVVAGAMASIHAGATLSASGAGSDNFSVQTQTSDSSSYAVRESYNYLE